MKVPEKVLIIQDEDTKGLSEYWCLRNRTNNPHIEYINKDAFIEKACDWLSKHAKKYYFNKERHLGTEELVEDFKLSMEMWYI